MSDIEERDAAWVKIESNLSADDLLEFISDLERVYRINSFMEFEIWQQEYFKALNLSNNKTIDTKFKVQKLSDGLLVTYSSLLKTSTCFQVEPAANGSLLVITDDYSATSEEERKTRMDEVDQSLVQWGNDLHRYLKNWQRWSRFAPWRWYMSRVWLSMKPSGRRIVRWIILITLAEFVAFLFVFLIWVL